MDNSIRLKVDRSRVFDKNNPQIRIIREERDGLPGSAWLYEDAVVVPSEEHLGELRDSIDEFLSGDGDLSERLVLDELTGLVHSYEGVGMGTPLSCGCDGIEESHHAEKTTLIERRHLENGIWEEAECLR